VRCKESLLPRRSNIWRYNEWIMEGGFSLALKRAVGS
jgi:hypothetical protein